MGCTCASFDTSGVMESFFKISLQSLLIFLSRSNNFSTIKYLSYYIKRKILIFFFFFAFFCTFYCSVIHKLRYEYGYRITYSYLCILIYKNSKYWKLQIFKHLSALTYRARHSCSCCSCSGCSSSSSSSCSCSRCACCGCWSSFKCCRSAWGSCRLFSCYCGSRWAWRWRPRNSTVTVFTIFCYLSYNVTIRLKHKGS